MSTVTWNILMVDDDEEDYVLTKGMLSQAEHVQFSLDWASTYEAGRQALKNDCYDVVLMDYNLGLHNGLELIRQAVADGCLLPFILYSGQASYEIDLEGMQAGVAVYLTKRDANPLLLERTIRYAVERKQSEKALADAHAALIEKNQQLEAAFLKLQQSEARFRSMFEQMTEGAALHTIVLDEHGKPVDYRFLEVNPAFEQLTGLKREAVIGQLQSQILPDSESYWVEIYGQVALTGQQIHFENYSAVLKRYFDVIAYRPAPLQFVAIFLDITERKQAEEVVRRFEMLSAHSRDIILFLEQESGRILDANLAALQAYGYTREELLGLAIQDLRAPKTRDLTLDQMQQANTDGILFETTHRRKDGSVFPVEVSSQGATIDGRRTLVSVVRDISKRKEAEQQLQEAHDRAAWLARFPEENPNPVLRLSENGEILYCNLACEPFLEPDEAGKTGLFENLQGLALQAVAKGEAIETEIYLAGKYFAFTIMPFLQERYINLYGLEITRRKQAEDQLRFQASILETIHDAVVVVDRDMRITSWNKGAERIYGWQAEEVLGRSSIEVLRTQLLDEQRAALSRDLTNGLAIIHEVIQYTKDDRPLTIAGYAIPLWSAQGEITGYVAVNHDITARKRAEAERQTYAERLEKSNRELENFAFAASHDLQEPLRKIEIFSRQLATKAVPVLGETERDYLARMQSATERMRRMIDGLLSLARITSKGRPFTQVDLNAVAQTVLDDLENQIQQTGGQVRLGDLPTVEGDATQLHQLLQNLISNGLKFHRPNAAPVVTLQARSLAGPRVELVVEDNGIGFDMAQADRLFQPFQRLRGRSEYEGTGIGLSICRKIVERHGGTIEAESKPGKGARIRVTLPGS